MIHELTGGLIQMNAHWIMSDGACRMILLGIIVVVTFAAVMIVCAKEELWKVCAVMAVFLLAGAALIYAGTRQPKIQEIRACASGPVSLEQVGTRYDIVNVDGKELTLRVRNAR